MDEWMDIRKIERCLGITRYIPANLSIYLTIYLSIYSA